ncbi:MAG: kynureninase, partial [Bacteroidia bacterium]
MFQNSLQFAREQDQQDSLKSYRDQFHIPKDKNGKDLIYFTGNSLGLQPKSVRDYIEVELKDWETLGVEGHFHGKNPWFGYHKMFEEPVARLVGALPHEVTVMNTLTTNLHLMMVSFYRPTKDRFNILVEGAAFPSDQYAVESQVRFHGFEPDKSIIEVFPRDGEYTLRTEDILHAIEDNKNELALVLIGGVNYYTGQAFEMEKITEAAHNVGALAGFDLAHAAGNLLLKLHDWNVDFAVWCSYKYLNSGPGGVSGLFVHEKWADDKDLPRFAGWWGYDEGTRFQMKKGFMHMHGAAGWQLSNAQILPMAAHKASIDIFDKVGMKALREKSDRLTGFLEYLINENMKDRGEVSFRI